MYSFTDLVPGTYDVCFDLATLPDGTMPTTPNVDDASAAGDALDSDADAAGCTHTTTLEPGEDDPTLDLGIHRRESDVSVTKQGAVTTSTGEPAGSTVTWTITVTNGGHAAVTGPIILTDQLPNGLGLVSTSGADACSTTDGLLRCTLNQGLAAGESRVLSIVTRVDATAAATFCSVTNSVTVSAGSDGTAIATTSGTTPLPCDELPVTGASTMTLVTLAGLLTAAGARLLWVANRERPVSIANRLG